MSGGRGRTARTAPPGGHCLPALPGLGRAVRPAVGERHHGRPTPPRASCPRAPRSPLSARLAALFPAPLPRGRGSRLGWRDLRGISTAGGRAAPSRALSTLTLPVTLEARGGRRRLGSPELSWWRADRLPSQPQNPGFGEEASRQLIRVGKEMPKDPSQFSSLRFLPGSRARTPQLAGVDSESRGAVIWSTNHVLRLGSMRWLRGISSSWVVNGIAKSGRMCVCVGGEVVDVAISGWRPGAGPRRQKLV